ncbi:hypothetical protein ACKWTF_000799 [Chironomus riparius]
MLAKDQDVNNRFLTFFMVVQRFSLSNFNYCVSCRPEWNKSVNRIKLLHGAGFDLNRAPCQSHTSLVYFWKFNWIQKLSLNSSDHHFFVLLQTFLFILEIVVKHDGL